MSIFRTILLISILFLGANVSFGQDSPAIKKAHYNLDKKGVAFEGYDVTTYFEGNPEKGNKRFGHTHKGVTHYFVNQQNLNKFALSNKKYEPAYGGWCAYAMGLNKPNKVAVNPKTYKIIDNKLYLFYNKFGVNTLEKWNKEGEKNLKNNADKNWNKIISE